MTVNPDLVGTGKCGFCGYHLFVQTFQVEIFRSKLVGQPNNVVPTPRDFSCAKCLKSASNEDQGWGEDIPAESPDPVPLRKDEHD